MAQIRGISGSTRYMISGTRAILGKKLTTLEEVQHFYNHYPEILSETEKAITKIQDEIILGFNNDEFRLAQQLQEGIA